MTMEDSRTQRPYRKLIFFGNFLGIETYKIIILQIFIPGYGMILLCLGALINWLGISEPTPNSEPIRYLGVACILGN